VTPVVYPNDIFASSQIRANEVPATPTTFKLASMDPIEALRHE
jgi:hypothetical protein